MQPQRAPWAQCHPQTPTSTRLKSPKPRNSKLKETSSSKVSVAFCNCAESKYDQALDSYSEAIFCNVPLKKKAIYYCNRSLVSLKTENYALAMFDAKDAVNCDETYTKAYYRLGTAHLALNQYDLAIKDFKKACQLEPKNKDARDKYEQTMKEYREKQLMSCLQYDE